MLVYQRVKSSTSRVLPIFFSSNNWRTGISIDLSSPSHVESRDYFKARDAIDFATLVDGIGHLGSKKQIFFGPPWFISPLEYLNEYHFNSIMDNFFQDIHR